MDRAKLETFLKKRENQILVLIIIFSVIYRLYYFFKLGNQPIWWDEGDYLAISKVWALNMGETEWMGHFAGMRPLLLPLIWTLFFKLGFGETFIRFFTILLPSLGAIFLVYLLGKELYDEKIGLIAGFMFSVYWVFTFYTYRLLTDIPATLLGLLSFFFFYKWYLKENKISGLYLCALFGVLAFSTRFPLALVLITCLFYLFFIKRFSLLKDKTFWKFILSLSIFAIPFIIYVISTKFLFIQIYLIQGVGGYIKEKTPFGYNVFGLSFSILENIWVIAFFLGLLTLVNLIICFDIFWKQKDKRFNADFFIILWIIIQYLFYVFVFRAANDRWILMLTIPMMFICSKGIMFVYNFLKKYSKILAIILFLFLLFGGAYKNIIHTRNLIEIKKDTYKEIKLAGEWFKENTPKDTKIITASIVQNQYYSERQSYSFFVTSNHNETLFKEKVDKLKPDYYVIHIFEPNFQPPWAQQYAIDKNLTLVKLYVAPKNYEMIYGIPENTPILAIYKF